MPRTRGLTSHLMLVAALAVAATTGGVIARQPLSMTEGFEKALSTSRAELTFNAGTHARDTRAGDEGYWLTRAEMKSRALFEKPMAVGDNITISGSDGVERKLEVVDVKAVGAGGRLDVETSAGLLLVTCRIAQDGADKPLVRFIVEGQLAPVPRVDVKAEAKAL